MILACTVCMLTGSAGMLPDDYENLSASVFGTLAYSNNILQAITTKDYWNVSNDFKPLMHTWYLGITVQFYLIIPFIVISCNKIAHKMRMKSMHAISAGLLLSSALSLIAFVWPAIPATTKFYFLPFRFFLSCLSVG